MIPSLICAALLALAPPSEGGSVTLRGRTFRVEVAQTDEQRARGLMYRDHLAKDQCMFFLYDQEGYHGIYMKNCLISLDVVWVSQDGTVLETVEQVPPCSPLRGDNCPTYGGTVESRHFVEFAAGTLKRLGVRKGDRISWDLRLEDGSRVRGGAQGRRAK